MSVENLANAVVENAAPVSDDDQLGALFDQFSRDNGSVRGDDGKFRSPNADTQAEGSAAPEENTETSEPPLEGEGGGEADENADSTPEVPVVPLPANWAGPDGKVRADLESIWSKLSADDQQALSKHQSDLHRSMSDQGRQISAFRPLQEAIERNRDLWEGKAADDGTPADARMAINFLFEAQRKLETDPARSLIEIADRFGARNALIAALVEQGAQPRQSQNSPSSRQLAGVTPAQIEEIVNTRLNHRLDEEAAQRAAQAELDRLSADKPFYAEIPENKMASFIYMAREDLGEAASAEAVFNRAYDVAVNADPILRAKAAAANAPKPKPAAQTDPRKAADARRAASVNVTSTKAGAPRKLSEDDELSSLYDELKAS